MTTKLLHRVVRSLFESLGYEIIPSRAKAKRTLLGVSEGIRSVVDVGANTGQFAREILKIVPGATLHCFEPLSKPYQQLSSWAADKKSIYTYNVALGDRNGEGEMFLHKDHDSSSSLLSTTPRTLVLYPKTRTQVRTTVPIRTLDSFMHEIDFEPGILIKLDVQGFEDRVIVGGRELFEKASACLIEISLEELYIGQPSAMRIFTLLDTLGYHYVGNLDQYYGPGGRVVFLDAVFARQAKLLHSHASTTV